MELELFSEGKGRTAFFLLLLLEFFFKSAKSFRNADRLFLGCEYLAIGIKKKKTFSHVSLPLKKTFLLILTKLRKTYLLGRK